MNSSLIRTRTQRVLTVAGALVLGASLASCGQAQGNAGPRMTQPDPTTLDQQAVAQQASAQAASDQTQGAAPASGRHPDTTRSSAVSRSASATNTNTGSQATQGTSTQGSATQSDTRCHTSMLEASLTGSDHGMGKAGTEVLLTNSSGTDCTIYGYGGLGLVGKNGQDLPTDLQRNPAAGAPQLITLAPGDSVHKSIQWATTTADGPKPCQAPRPTHLKVTPPDEEDWLVVPWTGDRVCRQGHIDGGAYTK